jgi:hypothetical protein
MIASTVSVRAFNALHTICLSSDTSIPFVATLFSNALTPRDSFFELSFLPTNTDKNSQISRMLSILRKARLKDKEMRILML